MIGTGTRGMHGVREDGRTILYRFVGDDWFGVWGTAGGGFHTDAEGTPGDDVFIGTDASEEYHGLGGDDTISGGAGRDFLYGDEGDDSINGDDGNDEIEGGVGHDVIHGGRGNDGIFAEVDGGDVVYGGRGDDALVVSLSVAFGGGGNDFFNGYGSELHGGPGNDRFDIYSPFVKDGYSHEVWGGSDADTFVFMNPQSSFLGYGRQVIHDLSDEDTIDLSQLDANQLKAGDQRFYLVPAFDGHTKEMTIRYDAEHDRTLIELYSDKDMKPDGTIIAPGDHTDFNHFIF